jgi:exonuclease III
MNRSCRNYVVLSWNVRGLGQSNKCVVVRDNVNLLNPSVVCLQETKLAIDDVRAYRSFLPFNLDCHFARPAVGSSGGILTAWQSNSFGLVSSFSSPFSITTVLQSTASNDRFAVTNIYGPSDHSMTDVFLDDLCSVAGSISDPWMLIGDFNLTRSPADKNNANFNVSLASRFNQTIDALQLIELNLRDRLYTWSNKRAVPTLARLDRAFICTGFGDLYPATFLASGPRPTSDHTPVVATIQTNIPKPSVFRLERSWLLDPSFLPVALSA